MVKVVQILRRGFWSLLVGKVRGLAKEGLTGALMVLAIAEVVQLLLQHRNRCCPWFFGKIRFQGLGKLLYLALVLRMIL